MEENTFNTILLLFVLYGIGVVHLLVKGKLPWLKPTNFEELPPRKKDERLMRKMTNQHLRIIRQPISRN